MTTCECEECKRARLNKEALGVTVFGKNIHEICSLSITECLRFIEALPEKLTEREMMIARLIIKEIKERLSFLESVGLNYLTLTRQSGSLSGGESQRIRLATQIGSSLVGVLYILDEPSIGLHQRDNDKLIATLKHLRDIGNTLIVVEHDEDTMRQADYVVDIGPGAGIHGGEVVFSGDLKALGNCKESITSDYLTGRKKIPVPEERRKGNGNFLTVKGAAEKVSNSKIGQATKRKASAMKNKVIIRKENEKIFKIMFTHSHCADVHFPVYPHDRAGGGLLQYR